MESREKQLDWGLLQLPGTLNIGPIFPVSSLLRLPLLKTLRGAAGEPLRGWEQEHHSAWGGCPDIRFFDPGVGARGWRGTN